jgi:hypothetical protein
MKAHKFKIEKTSFVTHQMVKIDTAYVGHAFTIQGVYYSSPDPNSRLHLYDFDKDECFFAIPGQINPHLISPDVAITITLPLYYMDETSGNKFIIFGTIERNGLQRRD